MRFFAASWLFIISSISNGQVFVAQRIVFEDINITKRQNSYVTELHNMNNRFTLVLDSGEHQLVDANYRPDSIELFYLTALNKIIRKAVVHSYALPAPLSSGSYSKYVVNADSRQKGIATTLADTAELSLAHTDFVRVLKKDSYEVAVGLAGRLYVFKQGRHLWSSVAVKNTAVTSVFLAANKKMVADFYEGRLLFIHYESGGLSGKPKNYLTEYETETGKVLFRSPYDHNINAFYVNNGDILLVEQKGTDFNVRIYDRQHQNTRHVVSYLNGTYTNAILFVPAYQLNHNH